MTTETNTLAKEAYNAGWDGRDSADMPLSRYADVGDNWSIWAEAYDRGQRDARETAEYYHAIRADEVEAEGGCCQGIGS